MSIWLQKKLPSTTEVVVIGGGIAGVSTAYHLAQADVRVVLLEAGEIATRATGRNDGQMLIGTGEHYNRVVSQFGEEKARNLLNFIEANNIALKDKAYTCQASIGTWGGLHMAETESEFEELKLTADLLKCEGIACHIVNEERLTNVLPVENFCGAIYIKDEAVVHPIKFTEGLAKLASAQGAQIYTHMPVAAVQATNEEYVVTLKDGQKIQTMMVVHCTSALSTHLDRSGFLEAQVFPYRGQVIATDSLDAKKIQAFSNRAMSSNFGYEYFRTYNNQFLLGGMRWSVSGQEEHICDDSGHNMEITKNLIAYTNKHFPTLRGAKFPHVWTGIMAGTKDGLPLVGEIPGQPGSFALLAFNGYGLSFAFKAGELIKDQIVDGQAHHPASSMFNPRRFV